MAEKYAQQEKKRVAEMKLITPADRNRCLSQLSLEVARHQAQFALRPRRDLLVRVCRLKHSHNMEMAEMTVRRACESRGINVYYGFANANDGLTPRLDDGSERAQKEDFRLSELKL